KYGRSLPALRFNRAKEVDRVRQHKRISPRKETAMSAATQTRISVGDEGVLNVQAAPSLSELWLDRDMGWLEFNERVLAEALDERTPLLERAKFLAIVTSNLDEFFMKRVAVLREGSSPDRKS